MSPLHLLGLLGLPSASSLVSDFLRALASWVVAGAGDLIKGIGAVLDATTSPPLGKSFEGEFSLVLRLGALFVPVLLLLAVIEAVIRQDLGLLLRALLLRAPVALLGATVAVEIVSLALRATDELSRSLIAGAGVPATDFLGALAGELESGTGFAAGGFEAFLLALVISFIALVLWLELAVRGAAITIALLFVPLALAGVVFPATAHWARRLAETLFALVLSKLIIAAVLALSVASIGAPSGPSGFVEGVAMLFLSTLAPFAVLRLVPFVEAGAVGHLEGLSRQAAAGARRAVEAIPLGGEGGLALALGAGEAGDVGLAEGRSFGGPAFEADVEQILQSFVTPDEAASLNDGEGTDPPGGRSSAAGLSAGLAPPAPPRSQGEGGESTPRDSGSAEEGGDDA